MCSVGISPLHSRSPVLYHSGENSQWNSDNEECECVDGYIASLDANFRRNPICVLCSGVGAYVDYNGFCKCGDGALLSDSSACECPEDLISDPENRLCYNGIDSMFDETQVRIFSRSYCVTHTLFSILAKGMNLKHF